eukprot:2515311-Pyramimonas_sp.AAC.1
MNDGEALEIDFRIGRDRRNEECDAIRAAQSKWASRLNETTDRERLEGLPLFEHHPMCDHTWGMMCAR